MIPVDQTQTGETGNCLSACFASLFECPIEDVPNFHDGIASDDDDAWWNGVRAWLRPKGFGLMSLQLLNQDSLALFEGIFIVCGKSCRGIYHATLWQNGKLLHDPHPSKCGLETVETIDMLYPLFT